MFDHYVWLIIFYQFISLPLEESPMLILGLSVHIQPRCSCTQGSRVVAFMFALLHLTPCCCVLDCLRDIFARPWPGILFGVVDPNSYCPCAQGLFLCFDDQLQCYLSDQPFLASCWSSWHQPLLQTAGGTCGFSFHDGSSSFSSSSLSFCCMSYTLSSSSLGAIFQMYFWIFVVASWMVALMLTNPRPLSSYLAWLWGCWTGFRSLLSANKSWRWEYIVCVYALFHKKM